MGNTRKRTVNPEEILIQYDEYRTYKLELPLSVKSFGEQVVISLKPHKED